MMYPRLLFFLFFFCPAFTVTGLYGQTHYAGNSEVYLADGILSWDQLHGALGIETKATGYMDLPDRMSGAAFITYRYPISNALGLGLSVGMDNQTGTLSYGKEGINGHMGVSGRYNRQMYTVAAELQLKYRTGYKIQYYGTIGAGYTVASGTFKFDDNISSPEFFYGTPNSMFPQKNNRVDLSHFNGQVTPFGVRSGGNLAVFFEAGFGYKGLISVGVCYSIGKRYPKLSELNAKSTETIAIIPPGYKVENLQDLGEIKTENSRHRDEWSFANRLADLANELKKVNGNAVLIEEIPSAGHKNMYSMRAEAYHARDPNALTMSVRKQMDEEMPPDSCAYVIIYYQGAITAPCAVLKINDTDRLVVAPGTKYVIRITYEGRMKISCKDDKVKFNLKKGSRYYVNVDGAKQTTELVDSLQGVVESGIVRKSYYVQTGSVIKESPDPPEDKPVNINTLVKRKVVFVPSNYSRDTSWENMGTVTGSAPVYQ